MKVFLKKTLDLVDFPREEEAKLLADWHVDQHRHVKATGRMWEAINDMLNRGKDSLTSEFSHYRFRRNGKEDILDRWAKGKAEITTVLEISKDVLYDKEITSNWTPGRRISSLAHERPGIALRPWGDYIIPVIANLNFMCTRKPEGAALEVARDTQKKVFEEWKYLDDECSFLYTGKPRGLYSTRETKRVNGARSIRKGDVVMIVDVDLRVGYTKFNHSGNEDLITGNFHLLKYSEFQTFTEQIGFWKWEQSISSGGRMLAPMGFLRLRSNGDLETTCVSGWLHVLVAGQHGWMKITNKPLATFQTDFIKDGTPEYKELFEWRTEQDRIVTE